MSDVIKFSTDKAALVVFDPELLASRVREPHDWWQRQPQHVIEEIAEGQAGIFAIGRHGSYRTALRVQEGPNETEAKYAVAKATGYGLQVASGNVFVGAAERLPGDGLGQVIAEIPDTGTLLPIEPGTYAITVHVLHWREEDEFYDEDNEVLEHAPPDYLVELTPVEARLQVSSSPEALRDLIPRAERKGQSKVHFQPGRKRRSVSSAYSPRRRRATGPKIGDGLGSGPPRPPRQVPSTVAAYHYEEVCAALRQVTYADVLSPPKSLPIDRLEAQPRDRTLQAHEIEYELMLKKFTRVREQIRMFESKVGTNKKLVAMDQLELGLPITQLYTSLDEVMNFLGRNVDFEAKPPPHAPIPAPASDSESSSSTTFQPRPGTFQPRPASFQPSSSTPEPSSSAPESGGRHPGARANPFLPRPSEG